MRFQSQIVVALAVVAVAAYGFYDWYNRPEQCYERATAALKRNDLDGTQREIVKLAKNRHFDLHNKFLRGNLLLRSGSLMEAIQELGPAMAHPMMEVDAMVLLGQANYQLGRPGPASQLWSRALSLDPDAVGAHLWLGYMYMDLGAMDLSVQHFSRAAELAPENARPHRVMGFIHKSYERFEFAVDDYMESLRRDPNQFDADDIRFELAHCQIRQHQYEEALQSLALVPDSSAVLSRRAECYLQLGDEQQARSLNQQALQTQPVDYDAYILQGQIHTEANEYDLAIEAFQDAVNLKPKVQEAHYKLSQAYNLAGKKDLADKHNAIGKELRDKWEQFSDMNHEAINKPADGELRYQIALLAEELERLDLAQTWLRTALSVDPQHAKAAAKLQDVSARIAVEQGADADTPVMRPVAPPGRL